MRPSSTAAFRKLKTCPPADTLLLHARGGLTGRRGAAVSRHLTACDFCGAESRLLSRHAPTAEDGPAAYCEMPLALMRLALELLARPPARRAEHAPEAERLTLTDA